MMTVSTSEKWVYLAAALFALFSWWLLQYTGIVDLGKPKRVQKSPDYFSKGYRKWDMDETGKLKSRLVAEETEHFNEYWATKAKKPVLEFVYPDKPSWIIASETGILSQDGKKLLLNGKVHIHRPEAPGFRQVIINTMNLKVSPETSYAETDAWSELLSPPNITTGKGMKAVFKEPIHLELLANVKGKYESKK